MNFIVMCRKPRAVHPKVPWKPDSTHWQTNHGTATGHASWQFPEIKTTPPNTVNRTVYLVILLRDHNAPGIRFYCHDGGWTVSFDRSLRVGTSVHQLASSMLLHRNNIPISGGNNSSNAENTTCHALAS